MNARLPQSNQTDPEKTQPEAKEKLKTPQQERADLSLDVQKKGRFEEAVEKLLQKGENTKETLEKGEKAEAFNWMNLSTNLALFAVGSYGMYRVGKWAKAKYEDVFEKGGKTEDENQSFPWWPSAALAVATGVALSKTNLFGWAEQLWNIKFESESLKKFAKTVQEKGVAEAYSELTYNTDEPFINALSEELDIEKRHLAELQTISYENFLKHREKDKEKSYLSAAMDWVNVSIDEIPLTNIDDELRRVQKENRLAEFIETNKKSLNLEEKVLQEMTLKELLSKILEARKAPKDNASTKEKKESKKEKITLTDNVDELDPSWEGIVKAAQDVEGKSKKEYETGIISETFRAGGILIEDDDLGTIIYKGGQGLLISSSVIFGSFVTNSGKAAVHLADKNYDAAAEDVYDFKETWVNNGGMSYLASGALVGAGIGFLKGDIVNETLSGAKFGLLGPAGVLWNTVRALQKSEKGLWQTSAWIEELYTEAEHKSGILQRLATRDPEAYKSLLKKQILKEGESYLKAYDRMETAYLKHYGSGPSTMALNFATIRQDKVLPGHLARIEENHFQEFANLWKTYQETVGGISRFPINTSSYTDKREELVKMIQELQEEWNPRVKRTDLTPEKKALTDAAFETKPFPTQVEELQKALKSADDYQKTAIEEYQDMKAKGANPTDLAKKVTDTKTELSALRTQFNSHLKRLSEASKSVVEEKLFKEFIDNDLSKGLGLRAIKTEIKSRGKWAIVLGVAEFVIATNEVRKEDTEAYATMKINELLKKVGPDVLQMICDVLSPFGLSDWANLATSLYDGKTWLSRKEMSNWDKASSLVFGTYSLASDALATLGAGASTVAGGSGGVAIYGAANALEVSLRTAGKSDDLIRVAKEMIPEISALASDLGGYPNLIKHLQKARSISGGAGTAITVVNVGSAAWAGVQILFDTRGEKAIEVPIETPVDMLEAGKPSTLT